MKKIIICLSILLLLFSCSDADFYSSSNSSTDVHVGSVLNDDVESQRFKSESELERERLDKEYRQTEYLEGFEDTHNKLEKELRKILTEYFDEHVTTEYAFSTDIKLTNLGYQLAKDKNLDLMSIVKEYPEYILYLNYYLIGYMDNLELNLDPKEALRLTDNFFSDEDGYALYELFDGELSERIIPVSTDVLVYQEELRSSGESIIEFYYDYFMNGQVGLEYMYITNGPNGLELQEKYKEEFFYYGRKYSTQERRMIAYYVPKRNINIRFQKHTEDDKYRASIFQYLMSERMEEILDRYNMRESIGYFVSAENHDNKGNTSGIEFTQNQLSKMTDTLNLTLYYVVDEGEEEDLDVLVDMLRDIYKDTDKVRLINVVIYFYELSERDQEIALKLLDEAKLSQNVLYDDSGMENWGQYIHRTRNDSDAFKFLDNFGLAREYIYHISYYVEDDFDVENLLRFKTNSRFD